MDALVTFIETVNTTPFRTIALVIGFLALSVGYGLKIKAVIDVENINKTYAKVVGAVLLILGFILFLPDITDQPGMGDPFLPYYFVSVFFIVMTSGCIMKFTTAKTQLTIIKGFFIFIAVAISFIVLWRGISVYFYVADAGQSLPPLGLDRPTANYLPYFVLLSVGFAAISWLIYTNTKQETNSDNRIAIFRYFAMLCVYLGSCRVIWEIIDLLGKKSLSP